MNSTLAHRPHITIFSAPSLLPQGGGHSAFRREDLEVYEACTCLSGAEVLELYEKFVDLGGIREKDSATEKIVRGAGADLRVSSMPADAETGGGPTGGTGRKIKKESVIGQSEFRNNPFKHRLCEIFSSEPAGSATYGDLSFDEFVDLYNVMSPRASKEVKSQTAFRLYDFDANGYLTPEDIALLLKTIATTPKKKELLTESEIKDIVERVMRDCDIDGNSRLSYAEFSKVLGRIPDFETKFRIYIQ